MELNASRSRWKQLYTCIYYEIPYKFLLFLFNWVVKSVVRPGFLWFYPDLLFLSLAVSVTHILIVLPFSNGKAFLSISVFSWIFSSGVMTYFSAVRHPLTENHHVIVGGVHASVPISWTNSCIVNSAIRFSWHIGRTLNGTAAGSSKN